jgi:hypothetical protein
MRHHPAANALRDLVAPPAKAKPESAVLDAAAIEEAKRQKEEQAALDAAAAAAEEEAKAKAKAEQEPVMDAAAGYQDSDIALKAVAAVQEWAETPPSELDEGEGSGDRLFSLLAGIADTDMDGEISDSEADIINMAANAAADYMIAKGVPEADAVALLEEYDNDLADRVQDLAVSSLPDGDEAAAAEIDAFVFGDGSDESVMDGIAGNDANVEFNGVTFDSITFASLTKQPSWMQMTKDQAEAYKKKVTDDPSLLDAVYKKKIVIRRGKKVRINKRVSGTVRLTAKQKVAVKKMLRKSHSAVAQMRRAKSRKVRQRSGL